MLYVCLCARICVFISIRKMKQPCCSCFFCQSWEELERDAQMADRMRQAAGDEGHVDKKRKTGR